MNIVNPGQGIERISQQGIVDQSEPVQQKEWQVPLGRPVCFLDQVFVQRRHVQKLEEYVQPQKISWWLMVPVRFKRVRDALISSLKDDAARFEGESSQFLLQAHAELMQLQENQQVLEGYRYSLIKI